MKKLSKIFAVVLCLVMVVSMLPLAVSAATEKSIEFTVDSLGLQSQAYTESTATVSGVGVEWIQLGNYGNGIQMRDSDKGTSHFWSTSALGTGITKIELTFSDSKSTYDNADAVIFRFGNAAKGADYTTKLSTVAGTKTYTITPNANTYTYFYMEHDLSYTFYWKSIKVYYNDTESGNGGNNGGSDPAPVDPPAESSVVKISTALAGADGTEFKVKGVVTLIDGKNIYLQDSTGGICVRASANVEDLVVGDVVIGTGSKSVYNGLPQLGGTYEKVNGGSVSVKETTIDALTTADVCTYVKLSGVTVTEVFDNNGAYSQPNVTVSDGTNTIQIYKAVVAKDGDNWAFQVGDVIDVYAAVGCYNSTLQLRNTVSAEIVEAGAEGPSFIGSAPQEPNQGTGDLSVAGLVVAMMAATAGVVVLAKKKEF